MALAELVLLDVVSLVELLLVEMPNCARVCSRAFSSALVLVGVEPVLPTLAVEPVVPALLLCEASNAWILVNALLDETLPMDILPPVREPVRPGAPGSKDDHGNRIRGGSAARRTLTRSARARSDAGAIHDTICHELPHRGTLSNAYQINDW